MNKLALIPVVIALALFVSCGKPQTEAERNAEIERQVQQRLDAEHQAETQRQLAAREADLAAREKALADQPKAPAAETPVAETPVSRTKVAEQDNSEPIRDVSTDENASYDTFYSKLDPYGDWRETADYGYVFQPRPAQGSRQWRPYTNGRWVYTEAGWTWVSEEPFGWATYHYGRWTRLRRIGWVWVPGNEWAPAWVSWRKSDDYVGWAPLPPEANFDRRAGIHQWADSYYDLGPEEYAFVSTNEFGSRRIEQILLPQERNITIVNQTTNVTNITYNNTTIVNQGPNYDDLSRRSRQPIERLRLERNGKFEGDNPRAIVRGDVIAMQAPFISPAQRRGRPARVKETITDTTVDHGALENTDRPAAENARAKMHAESTPPVGLPAKKFVRPAVAPVPVPLRPQRDESKTPMGTAESAPIQKLPDDHRKELDQQRLQKEAQRRAEQDGRAKQMIRPLQTPAASVPASPAPAPVKIATPPAATPVNIIPPPVPAATMAPARRPVRDAGKLPLPNDAASKQVPAMPPAVSAPPVRAKIAPPPVATMAPSATVPAENPVRNFANPPMQKRVPVPPQQPRAMPPRQVVPPPVATEATAISKPVEQKGPKPGDEAKAPPPRRPPPATASPADDGKEPR